jgi:serine/threonine-protein kinase RsbW
MGGLLPERIDDLKTAVAEACLNAIEHGNQGRPDARVIVVMNLDNGEFSVSVLDEGEGIRVAPAPPNIQKQVENLEPPNGLGLFLIKELVDHVDFNASTTEGHVVKMIVKISN